MNFTQTNNNVGDVVNAISDPCRHLFRVTVGDKQYYVLADDFNEAAETVWNHNNSRAVTKVEWLDSPGDTPVLYAKKKPVSGGCSSR